MFNYEWFHGLCYQQQKDESRRLCARRRFPDFDPDSAEEGSEAAQFYADLEARTLIYLRDGFSYEVRYVADIGSKSHLVFECEPVDEQYKVGAFVVSVPFDEIVRVEVFAVHPGEKPEDMPQITGFRHYAEPADQKSQPRDPKKG